MEKKTYHFIKEIYEQPKAIYQSLQYADPILREISAEFASKVRRVIFTGCGDPYMLGQAAAYAFEMWAGIPAQAIEAAELAMYRKLMDEHTLVVLITSSGKTVKVIDVACLAKQRGAPTFALTNLVPSPITDETERVIQTQAGWSDSFPTKQTSSALAVLYALALHWAEEINSMSGDEIAGLRHTLYEKVPTMIEQALQLDAAMQALAGQLVNAPIYTFIGSGPNLATALLSAAKMKETSQSRSEACNLEEYAHLHCLSLKEQDPVFIITEPGSMGERNRLVCEHVKANGGSLVVIGPETESNLWKNLDVAYYQVPDHPVMYGPLVAWVPLQLFAYHTAIVKGRNPDRPPHHGPLDYLQKIIYTSMLEGWEDR